ncbi:MAG: HAD family phosphatase [Methylacidiphilales bacterium]|nr:HAD family phosphatase [Candidatus Methylacidiphilales bacterium]MDW8350082.1 HAD family phosphatase [Verrucomicrobiae bacterium]
MSYPRSIKGILLDYDGVLADTMPDNHKAWAQAFAEHGVQISQNEYYLLEGSGRLVVSQTLCRLHGIPLENAESIARRKDEIMVHHSASKLFPSILPALQDWSNRSVALGLVTGASLSRVLAKIPKEVRDYFHVIVTSNDVTHTKPDPEPYAKAIQRLGFPPEQCLVIENAPLGIRSAKAAGAYCFAIMTTLPKSYLLDADLIFPDHEGCFQFIARLLHSQHSPGS